MRFALFKVSGHLNTPLLWCPTHLLFLLKTLFAWDCSVQKCPAAGEGSLPAPERCPHRLEVSYSMDAVLASLCREPPLAAQGPERNWRMNTESTRAQATCPRWWLPDNCVCTHLGSQRLCELQAGAGAERLNPVLCCAERNQDRGQGQAGSISSPAGRLPSVLTGASLRLASPPSFSCFCSIFLSGFHLISCHPCYKAMISGISSFFVYYTIMSVTYSSTCGHKSQTCSSHIPKTFCGNTL